MKRIQKMLNLTVQEWNWVLYDIGNSAFILLVTAIVPIYFNSLAEAAGLSEAQYLSYWGFATSIATIVVALTAPWPTTRISRSPFSPCACCWVLWAARHWARRGRG